MSQPNINSQSTANRQQHSLNTEQTGQFEKQMISYPSSRTLPPEIISLVLEEFDYDIWPLRKCSLVCKSWRNLSLPFLFHHLCLSDGKIFLCAFRLLVVDAPHIGQFVREILIGKSIAATSSELGFLENTTDKERLEVLFLALPGLKVLHCGFGGHLTIPLTLLRSSITTLYLNGTIEPINELMILLQAGAETIRFLTIQNVVYRGLSSDQLLSRNMPFPGCMLALEELSIIWCDELPFLPSTIQMPNLRTLKLDNCDGSILSCVPASLETLAFQIEPDMSLPANKLLTVENVVVFCDTVDIDDQLSEHMIGKLCVTSVIKQLELLLLFFDCGDDIPHDFAFMIDKDFEDDMLRLHRHGSLERVIVTSKFCPEMVHAMFPKLSNLCILDVRTSDVSPVLAPQRRRFINTRNGLWSWSSSW